MMQWSNVLKSLSALLVLTLTAACASSRPLPADTIVETKVVKTTIDPPAKPDQIPKRQIVETPEVFTPQIIIGWIAPLFGSTPEEVEAAGKKIAKAFRDGTLPRLNHIGMSIDEWAEYKRHRFDIKLYIQQSEAYFADVEKQVREINEANAVAREEENKPD